MDVTKPYKFIGFGAMAVGVRGAKGRLRSDHALASRLVSGGEQ